MRNVSKQQWKGAFHPDGFNRISMVMSESQIWAVVFNHIIFTLTPFKGTVAVNIKFSFTKQEWKNLYSLKEYF